MHCRHFLVTVCAIAICVIGVGPLTADNVKMGDFIKVLSTDIESPPGVTAAWGHATAALGDIDGPGGPFVCRMC